MDRNNFRKILSRKILVTDGAMGTMLQKNGLQPSQSPEELNISNPSAVRLVHKAYLDAGSNIIFTNTFGATAYKLRDYCLQDKTTLLNTAGVKLAKEIAASYNAFVAGDIGPVGSFLTPIGTMDFDTAYGYFFQQARALSEAGADLLILETFSDIRELKAALLAARDSFNGPVIASMTFTKEGRTVTGTDIASFAATAESMGADCIGLNCSVGPKHLLPLVKLLARKTNLPISVKPNRGIPQLLNNETFYPGSVAEFLRYSREYIKLGVNLIGGCCGTNPEFIKALSKTASISKPRRRRNHIFLRFSSRTKTLEAAPSKKLTIIGERINPTGRKALQNELKYGNFTTVINDAKEQAVNGADMLDINMGLPGGDEKALMAKACELVQSHVDLPLCIDSSSPEVLEEGLKQSCGKSLINSINGEEEKLEKILPLAKRYGAGLICLTTDSTGIPKTAAERIKIAKKIIKKALEYGIPKDDLLIDNLTLSLGAQQNQAVHTLKAINICKKKLKIKTVLGISNISYGLPQRELINSTFLKLAKKAGLNFAIINPYHNWDIFDEYAHDALTAKDRSCLNYISRHPAVEKKQELENKAIKSLAAEELLYQSVLDGRKENVGKLVEELISKGTDPLEINRRILLEALKEIGGKFDRKLLFLPQVLLSAETIHAAFGVLKNHIKKDEISSSGRIIIATVKGDIHDIGKNIVGAVLESHGFEVIDLGKNVESARIIGEAISKKADIIGLSALMTTTMTEMKKVIETRNKSNIDTPIIVGGAAVTRNYAQEIGANGYAKDALEAAKIAKSIISN